MKSVILAVLAVVAISTGANANIASTTYVGSLVDPVDSKVEEVSGKVTELESKTVKTSGANEMTGTYTATGATITVKTPNIPAAD